MKTNTFTTASRRYLIESYGNGWAYTVTDQETGADFFVQDESASAVQFQTNNFEDETVLAEYFDAFDQGE